MFVQQISLERAIFDGGIAQHDDLFLGPRQQRVAANLKIGLTTRDSVVTLTGALGVGKTTIAAHVLSITATRLAQTWLGNTPLAPDEMLESLLAAFELAPYEMGRVQRLHTWRQFVGEMSATDTRVCILVENALALGPEGLQALEALTAADPNDCPGANLILMGPTQLQQLLEEPGLARLKQRIRSRQRLDPMTPQEVEQYLRHRMTVAGGDFDTIFAPGTAAMVHSYSAGIPRVINNVCETALVVAGTRKATQLTPEIVQRIAEGVYGLARSVQPPEAPVATAPAPAAPAVAAVMPPAEKPVPPAEPAPVNAAARAPAAARVAIAEQPAKEAVPPAELAPVESAEELVDAPEPQETEEFPADLRALLDDPEAFINRGDVPAGHANAEPQDTLEVSGTAHSVEHAQEPPVLTDAIDMDVRIEIKDVVADARPPAPTLSPEAPALPDKELQPDQDFSEDFAAATHLHEISDEMAELLFSADPAASATGIFKAAAPLDGSDLDLSPARTAVMQQLDEDTLSEAEEKQTDPIAAAATTLVF